MAETPSTMLPLNSQAPNFQLIDTVDNKEYFLTDFEDAKALLVVFTSNHCPYAVLAMPQIVKIAQNYKEKGLSVVAISSNAIDKYPQDGPKYMKENALDSGYTFPYLFDETQEVAKAYKAACTPDLYLFDDKQKLVYRGQLDDSRPGNGVEPTGNYLREALDQYFGGEVITVQQKPSMGCNIKWKDGNEPDYY